MSLISAEVAIARAIATAPDVPLEPVETLRCAFDHTMKDQELLAEAARLQLDISPASGAEVQKLVADIVNASADVVNRAKEIVAPPK